MKPFKFLILLLATVALFGSCESDESSHSFITLKNNSNEDIYLCHLFTNGSKCTLSKGGILKKDSSLEYAPYNGEIEKQLRGGSTLELYLVDPNNYNEHNIFYDCDSIAIKNDILMHYELSLEDLERMNWEVVYPPIEE